MEGVLPPLSLKTIAIMRSRVGLKKLYSLCQALPNVSCIQHLLHKKEGIMKLLDLQGTLHLTTDRHGDLAEWQLLRVARRVSPYLTNKGDSQEH